MEKTIFERIILGEIPCHKVYEDKDTFAFLDINPHNPGHTLVVPKLPYKDMHEVPNMLFQKLMQSVQKISISIKGSLKADGVKIVINNGSEAGQIIYHLHVHIIPYYKKTKSVKKYSYKKGEAEKIARKISSLLV